MMSLLGNPLLRLQPAMIQAASAAGVTHFYPGEWNSDIDQPEIANMRYFRDKQATRAQCHATAQENPNFKYTIFLTGIFTEWTSMLAGMMRRSRRWYMGIPRRGLGRRVFRSMIHVPLTDTQTNQVAASRDTPPIHSSSPSKRTAVPFPIVEPSESKVVQSLTESSSQTSKRLAVQNTLSSIETQQKP